MKKLILVVAVLAVVALAAAGSLAYAFLRTPEAASQPIEAIPLDLDNNQNQEAGAAVDEPAPGENAEPQAAAAPAEPVEETAVQAPEEATTAGESAAEADTGGDADVVPDAEAEAAASEAASQPDTEGEAAAPILFEIVPAESAARFYIDEVLQGDPITVVGVTDQVAGQFAVTPADLSTAQVGVIQVNARTLATDNEYRNRAIKNRILLTDQHEFVTFSPTGLIGLPESGQVGETYTFQLAGDLTIIGNTRPVIFEVTATPVSETRIEGTATTAFLYTDFNLFIPDARVVDTVDDEVRLELEFVAEGI